jgi:hypothetical protein
VEAEVQHILLQPVQVEAVQHPIAQIQIIVLLHIVVLLIIVHPLIAVEALHQAAVHLPEEAAVVVVVVHEVPVVTEGDVVNILN